MTTQMVTPQQAAQIGDALLNENNSLKVQVEKLQADNEKIKNQQKELIEKYKQLRQFESLLEDPPKRYLATLDDPQVILLLQGAALKIYGAKAGRYPDDIQDNEKLRRLARMNWNTIIHASLRYALGPAFNKVYNSYIRPVKV